MDENHRTILSMYYRNPDHDPRNTTDWFCSMGMDVTQLLLLNEGVFGICGYALRFAGRQVRFFPTEEGKKEYESLIDKVDENLKKAEIIDVSSELDKDDFKDFCLRNSLSRKDRERCYHLSMLTANINGTHKVYERDSIVQYCLFSGCGGKLIIGYLQCVLNSVVTYGLMKTEGNPNRIISVINCDYYQAYSVYQQRRKILNQLLVRSQNAPNYSDRQLKRAEMQLGGWIEEKQAQQGNMIEFIFRSGDTQGKSCAIILVKQIVDILDVVMEGCGADIQWKQETDALELRRIPVLYKELNAMTEKLKENFSQSEFNRREWAYVYLRKLTKISSAK